MYVFVVDENSFFDVVVTAVDDITVPANVADNDDDLLVVIDALVDKDTGITVENDAVNIDVLSIDDIDDNIAVIVEVIPEVISVVDVVIVAVV